MTTSPLRAASLQFEILPELDADTGNKTDCKVDEVCGPLKTTVTLLDDGGNRVCLITTHFGPTTAVNVSKLFRETIAEDLGLPVSSVLFFTSHNHSSVVFASNEAKVYDCYSEEVEDAELVPVGVEFLAALRSNAQKLTDLLQPVTVWWAEGSEGRFTFNRKGRLPDGGSYFIRDEDRLELGDNYIGDIDTQAPIVILKGADGEVVSVITQFTGHPVTSFHPEHPIVFGDWSQVACDEVADHFSQAPVGFLQGCAGDINSKEMFTGGVKRATEFGKMLGESYIAALENLQPSSRAGMDFSVENVKVALAPLPSREFLISELEEMDDFIKRANSGDEDTLFCVGLNFPKALSPAYRSRLVDIVRNWNVWALDLYEKGEENTVATHLELQIAVIRIGDVGIVGLPCEPFQGIGRQIRSGSTLPVSIPCGYMNVSHGYITDSANTGDQEYMSAFYRYTKFRPPLEKPAGDVLAESAVSILNQFDKETSAS